MMDQEEVFVEINSMKMSEKPLSVILKELVRTVVHERRLVGGPTHRRTFGLNWKSGSNKQKTDVVKLSAEAKATPPPALAATPQVPVKRMVS